MDAATGHIEVILGPMFSGKTTELMRRLRRYGWAGKRCRLIKYARDTRYSSEKASTHDRQEAEAISLAELDPSNDAAFPLAAFDVFGIDEGQFFPNISFVAEKLANAGKIVVVAALNGTYQRKTFGDVHNLLPIAERLDMLNAVCMTCKRRDAAFSKRIDQSSDTLEDIGGAEKYVAVCRRCHGRE